MFKTADGRAVPQRQASEETRRQILDTSLGLFREKGFEETTIRDIARASGLSLGAAYYYFKSKEAIVGAYYDFVQHEHLARARAAYAAGGDLRDRLRAALHAKILLRAAVTMSPDAGGIFDTLLRLVRRGLGGTAGSGRQFVSWIHRDDFVGAMHWLIDRAGIDGAVNVASPHPVPNAAFMQMLREAAGVRIGLPASWWMLEAGALLMRTETELLLKSRRVVPGRLLESGFRFTYPEWRDAAHGLCREWRHARRSVAHSPRPQGVLTATRAGVTPRWSGCVDPALARAFCGRAARGRTGATRRVVSWVRNIAPDVARTLRLETDPSRRRAFGSHQPADGIEHRGELAVVPLFERVELAGEIRVGLQDTTQLYEGPHDLDVHADRALASQHGRQHRDALFGEGVRTGPSPAMGS
jgi:AcrR family transcriptional regulator